MILSLSCRASLPKNSPPPKQQSSGFTLVELLVAVAIFAVVSVLAYGGLDTLLRLREGTDLRSQQLRTIQLAYAITKRDLEQMANRPVKDQLGDQIPAAFLANERFEFTSSGLSNPLGIRRSDFQRIGYQIDDEKLQRLSWPVLDRGSDTTAMETTLIPDVLQFQLKFLDQNKKWQNEWNSATMGHQLPKAIEVNIELKNLGDIRWLFEVGPV